MDRAAEQVEHRGRAFFRAKKGDRGLLIEPENGCVWEDNGRSTVLLDPHPVTRTEGVVQAHRLPLRLTRSLRFYAPLHGDNFGYPYFTRAGCRRAGTQRGHEEAQPYGQT